MKLLITFGAVLVAISLFMLINSVYAECGNMPGDCDSNGNSNYNPGVQEDDGYIDDNNDGVNDENDNNNVKYEDDGYIDDGQDDSHKHNVKYNGLDDNHKSNDNHKGHSSDNHNHKKAVEKFNVHVYVDFGYAQSGDKDSIRVIVYGPHTLNKPTLDKPGTPIYLGNCDTECYQDAGVWQFTSWKVPQGASFKACVSNQSGNESCDWGYANSRHESIHVRAD